MYFCHSEKITLALVEHSEVDVRGEHRHSHRLRINIQNIGSLLQ